MSLGDDQNQDREDGRLGSNEILSSTRETSRQGDVASQEGYLIEVFQIDSELEIDGIDVEIESSYFIDEAPLLNDTEYKAGSIPRGSRLPFVDEEDSEERLETTVALDEGALVDRDVTVTLEIEDLVENDVTAVIEPSDPDFIGTSEIHHIRPHETGEDSFDMELELARETNEEALDCPRSATLGEQPFLSRSAVGVGGFRRY